MKNFEKTSLNIRYDARDLSEIERLAHSLTVTKSKLLRAALKIGLTKLKQLKKSKILDLIKE